MFFAARLRGLLFHPLWPFKFLEALSLAPGEKVARFLIDSFVLLRFLKQIRVGLLEPHPFDLLLKEAKIAAGPGPAPLGVGRHSYSGVPKDPFDIRQH